MSIEQAISECVQREINKQNVLSSVRLLTGNGHIELAKMISKNLDIPLTPVNCGQFSNQETYVEISANVRRKNVYIISTGSEKKDNDATNNYSLNDILMETLIMIDACKRSHAKSITVIMPCYPYARQDRKDASRAPITAKLVANMLMTAGATRMMVIDLHAGQIQGFFDIPVDNLYADHLMVEHLKMSFNETNKVVIVSPDSGGAKRAEKIANRLSYDFAIMHKKRDYSQPNTVEKTTLVGDVHGKIAVIVDDMCDTAGTLIKACETLTEQGALFVFAIVTHGVLSGLAHNRINSSNHITKLICSNSLPTPIKLKKLDETSNLMSKIEIFDVSHLISEAIRRIITGGSISELF